MYMLGCARSFALIFISWVHGLRPAIYSNHDLFIRDIYESNSLRQHEHAFTNKINNRKTTEEEKKKRDEMKRNEKKKQRSDTWNKDIPQLSATKHWVWAAATATAAATVAVPAHIISTAVSIYLALQSRNRNKRKMSTTQTRYAMIEPMNSPSHFFSSEHILWQWQWTKCTSSFVWLISGAKIRYGDAPQMISFEKKKIINRWH